VGGYEALVREIDEERPAIVVLQEILDDSDRIFALLRARYAFAERSTQFMVASRHPIVSQLEPKRIPHQGRERSPRFVRYLIDAPLGRIALYNVHPISPSDGFNELRGRGLKREILSGRIFTGESSGRFESDRKLRALQVRAFAEMARKEAHPVVIAGDINLPSLSPLLRHALGRYADGFRAAGWGFGYTFPGERPWLRLDRVLASDSLSFVRFAVGGAALSDHRYVVADLQRAEP
jgi:endonuclease/exonuclease/phosphatase (EEP) superfamily protein YafD